MEEVKLAIKPYYQRKDINKDEYKDILRKAVHKVNAIGRLCINFGLRIFLEPCLPFDYILLNCVSDLSQPDWRNQPSQSV